ncbi:hypothetical protein NPIL_480521 [Nephila pilipes]|uniref:Uncharacterized protein n=1 Tax=Nephila pilipes TaxID=299642 RepID=A0A8X6N1P7_NEPPI|nr:hypothetical protein NPIL_480521 [Nephila pilipes]
MNYNLFSGRSVPQFRFWVRRNLAGIRMIEMMREKINHGRFWFRPKADQWARGQEEEFRLRLWIFAPPRKSGEVHDGGVGEESELIGAYVIAYVVVFDQSERSSGGSVIMDGRASVCALGRAHQNSGLTGRRTDMMEI